MPIRIQHCESCRFVAIFVGLDRHPNPFCARYPQGQEFPLWGWCGEWRIDAEKACRAKSPPISTGIDRLLSPRDRPFWKPMHVPCVLPKKHEGDHTDGMITWENTDGKVA